MTELDIVSRLRKYSNKIGDDCAVLSLPGSRDDLLLTMDLMVENVHWVPGDSPRQIGKKAVIRSLSDIAAMGGDPRYCLISLALPKSATRQWIDNYYQGAVAVLRRYGAELVGGDLSRSDTLTCDVMICGTIPRGKALKRGGARPGDRIYVSGPLGAAASRGYSVQNLPEPRIALGRKLRGKATACMDISDGLSIDLHRLCLESRCAASLDGAIPIARGATLEHALHGGEDYELLFTLPPSLHLRIADIHQIGIMQQGTPGAITMDGKPLKPAGHDHFRNK
jgi:thiamine-monophosphate kinase